MNVLYTCDNNYIWLMIMSMISLFKTNNKNKITVYLIGENISDSNKELLKKIAEDYFQTCIVIDLPDLKLPEKLYNSSRWPKSAYTRLFSANILPVEVKNIIYLDCDTIIKNDLSELIEVFQDDDSKVIYGVKDCISNFYKHNIGLNSTDIYINAGVLLINLEKLREVDVYNQINSFLSKYEKLINYADQDILNGIFASKLGFIHPKFNVMTIEFTYSYKEILKIRRSKCYYMEKEIREAVKNPYIIHYTTNMLTIRPWFKNSNHPRKADFLDISSNNKYLQRDLSIYEFKGIKNKFLKYILKLPNFCKYNIIGFIHSLMVPMIKLWKGKLFK